MIVDDMMVLLIDNYDSFVFNLARYVAELGCETCVERNDTLTIDDIRALQPDAVIISPGPCTPKEAGVSVQTVQELGSTIPILGVCLGHQAIAAAFGADVVQADEPIHGRTSLIHHEDEGIFVGIPNPFTATRYHSLVVPESSLPDTLHVTARTECGIVMAIAHALWPVYGVQFHPESVLTPDGHHLLANFLKHANISVKECPEGDLPAPPKSPTTREWDYRDTGSIRPLTW